VAVTALTGGLANGSKQAGKALQHSNVACFAQLSCPPRQIQLCKLNLRPTHVVYNIRVILVRSVQFAPITVQQS
jgi:hypothetical protein